MVRKSLGALEDKKRPLQRWDDVDTMVDKFAAARLETNAPVPRSPEDMKKAIRLFAQNADYERTTTPEDVARWMPRAILGVYERALARPDLLDPPLEGPWQIAELLEETDIEVPRRHRTSLRRKRHLDNAKAGESERTQESRLRSQTHRHGNRLRHIYDRIERIALELAQIGERHQARQLRNALHKMRAAGEPASRSGDQT